MVQAISPSCGGRKTMLVMAESTFGPKSQPQCIHLWLQPHIKQFSQKIFFFFFKLTQYFVVATFNHHCTTSSIHPFVSSPIILTPTKSIRWRSEKQKEQRMLSLPLPHPLPIIHLPLFCLAIKSTFPISHDPK